MKRNQPRGFSLLDLIVVIALLGLLLAVMLPAVVKMQRAAGRISSSNNMRQLMVGMHNFHADFNRLPEGCDKKGYSVHAQLLPYIEQQAVYNSIDFEKEAAENAKKDFPLIKTFLDPRDKQEIPKGASPNNYFFCAGSKPRLKDNGGIFAAEASLTLAQITNADGSSNTIALGISLRGDGGNKAVNVARQHVFLKDRDERKKLDRGILKNMKDDTGLDSWKDNENIVGDRGSAWLQGYHLQTVFTATREFNDEKPDVTVDGLGGFSALRSMDNEHVVGFCDASVRTFTKKLPFKDWQALCDYNDGIVVRLPE